MEILLFIACGLVLVLMLEVYGILIRHGYRTFSQGVTQALGASDAWLNDPDCSSTDQRRWLGRVGGSNLPLRQRHPSVARLVRGALLLSLLAGELYAGQSLFGSLVLGFLAWIATVLISLAVA